LLSESDEDDGGCPSVRGSETISISAGCSAASFLLREAAATPAAPVRPTTAMMRKRGVCDCPYQTSE
jgi:hypothetical protein